MSDTLVYGAYGYTGELVAREAVEAGLDPVLAGRREAPLAAVANELGLPYEVADLEGLEAVLGDVDVLLHCAGPFVHTFEPAVEACLATGTHYVDITGEIPVFEAIRTYDDAAREAGIMLLPGGGFDVVPSDCLAARLHERLPSADKLTLAFDGLANVSPGTARTAARMLGEGVPVREDGTLRTVRFGSRTRAIDTGTGEGPRRMGIFPWGDVSTAYHTTGIPSIEVYASLGFGPTAQRVLGVLQPLLRTRPVRRALVAAADRLVTGPGPEARAAGSAFFWGAASDGERTVSGRVHTPESYRFTAASTVAIARRVLAGEAPAGYQTPASAYGPELVTAVEGARFEGLDPAPDG